MANNRTQAFSASELPPCFWPVVWTKTRLGVAAQNCSVAVVWQDSQNTQLAWLLHRLVCAQKRQWGLGGDLMDLVCEGKALASKTQQERRLLHEEYIDTDIGTIT